MNTTTVSLPPTLQLNIDLTDEQFFQLCQNNRDLKFERTASGELIIMPPTGSSTSDRNADLTYQLRAWSRQNKLGKSFDSSGGFKLPNGAERSPDASWVKMERWNALSEAEKERFAPLCPDFVVELMSPSNSLEKTRAKMREYIENGARLGWLINRGQQQVEIYRPNREVEILQSPKTLLGENILPGFVLDLAEILCVIAYTESFAIENNPELFKKSGLCGLKFSQIKYDCYGTRL
ncbi:Uma2 family endonuclease [Nostoc sp. BAE]|nr:Uma2 family endonuclease [Nostoc commune BAE]